MNRAVGVVDRYGSIRRQGKELLALLLQRQVHPYRRPGHEEKPEQNDRGNSVQRPQQKPLHKSRQAAEVIGRHETKACPQSWVIIVRHATHVPESHTILPGDSAFVATACGSVRFGLDSNLGYNFLKGFRLMIDQLTSLRASRKLDDCLPRCCIAEGAPATLAVRSPDRS